MESNTSSGTVITLGVIITVTVCIAGILTGFPIWLTILATLVLAFATAQLSQTIGKRLSFASDKSLSRLLFQADKLKNSNAETDKVERAIVAKCQNHPEAWKGYKMLGELFIVRGNRNRAWDYFLRADKEFPESVSDSERAAVWNEIGGVAMASGRKEDAEAFFQKASEVDPSYYRGLGILYSLGWSEGKDADKALACFAKAISGGCDAAVANLYELRWRVSNDVDKYALDRFLDYLMCCHGGRGYRAGVHALKESAARGYVPAQFELGTLYQHAQYGDDTPTRRKEAFRWLKSAADQGYLPAIHNFGFLVQQCVIDPVKGDIFRPAIKGTILYRRKDIDYCAAQGAKLIRRAAEAGYEPSRRCLGWKI